MKNNLPDDITSYRKQEELESLKHQLFMENVRIQTERSQIESEYEELRKERRQILYEKKRLEREKKQLTLEMSELKEQVQYERRRLKEDEKLLERKQKIVENAFEMLDSDKMHIQSEYRKINLEKQNLGRMKKEAQKEVYATGLFFRGVNNQIALKKRYKELLKIYHPDNICGDNEILLKINEEYEELRQRLSFTSGIV